MRLALRMLVLVLAGLGAGPALAVQPATSDTARAEAREHFARGLHLFENEDNLGALAEFKRAYELIPNRVVLFNLGLVYASAGDPVNAVDTLAVVLESPREIKPEQLERARRVREEQEARIGSLQIATGVPADIAIDGTPVGRTPMAVAVRLAGGTHIVAAVADGYSPTRQEINLKAGSSVDLVLNLHPTQAPLAHLTVETSVPGAYVFVDGTRAGQTPLPAPLALDPGTRAVEVRRFGYVAKKQEVTLAAGAQAQARFELEPDARLGEGPFGELSLVSPDSRSVQVTIDGKPLGLYQDNVRLPAGPHHMRLERLGYEPLAKTVVVAAGRATPVKAELRPTTETRRAYRAHAVRNRAWAIAALLGGLVVASSAGGFSYWSDGRLDDANVNLSKVEAQAKWGSGGSCDPSKALSSSQYTQCVNRMADARDDVSRYRSMRNWGIAGASLGAAVLVGGIVLMALGQDPKRYDEQGTDVFAFRSRWVPAVGVGPAGASLGLAAQF